MSAAPAVLQGSWRGEDTTPTEIDEALRDLVEARHAESGTYAPARVLNLVVVADSRHREEVAERLERIGRSHPSRTIVLGVEEGRTRLDARAALTCGKPGEPGELTVCRERLELDVGPEHLPRLDSITGPLLVTGIDTLVWSPDGHPEAVDALAGAADSVLLDSGGAPDRHGALDRAAELSERTRVVDLAWLRSAPWRERVAAAFDPPASRAALQEGLRAVTVRHHPDSVASAALLIGWLGARLGLTGGTLHEEEGLLAGRAEGPGGEVELRVERCGSQEALGLSEVSIEAVSGLSLRLDRGPGGLRASRRSPYGRESQWVVLGASRGEPGILAEGIRQALLRSALYAQALAWAVGALR